MAHNTLLRADLAAWNVALPVTPGEFWGLDLGVYESINGDQGGTWTPAAAIEIGGAGVLLSGTDHQISGTATVLNAGVLNVDAGGFIVVDYNGTVRFDGSALASNYGLIFNNGAGMQLSGAAAAHCTIDLFNYCDLNVRSNSTVAIKAGATETVESGGTINVDSGGFITVDYGGTVRCDGNSASTVYSLLFNNGAGVQFAGYNATYTSDIDLFSHANVYVRNTSGVYVKSGGTLLGESGSTTQWNSGATVRIDSGVTANCYGYWQFQASAGTNYLSGANSSWQTGSSADFYPSTTLNLGGTTNVTASGALYIASGGEFHAQSGSAFTIENGCTATLTSGLNVGVSGGSPAVGQVIFNGVTGWAGGYASFYGPDCFIFNSGATGLIQGILSHSGAGRVTKRVITGADASTAYNADNADTIVAESISATRTYSLTAGVHGDEITIANRSTTYVLNVLGSGVSLFLPFGTTPIALLNASGYRYSVTLQYSDGASGRPVAGWYLVSEIRVP